MTTASVGDGSKPAPSAKAPAAGLTKPDSQDCDRDDGIQEIMEEALETRRAGRIVTIQAAGSYDESGRGRGGRRGRGRGAAGRSGRNEVDSTRTVQDLRQKIRNTKTSGGEISSSPDLREMIQGKRAGR